jgi:TIR domain
MAKVFFSYSHKDEALRDQLETHLAMLKNQGLIESWHDRRILAGAVLDEAIFGELEDADVILLLISSDFLASAYCFSKEMQRAMERHKDGTARVIPVILRDCDWKSAPFGQLMATPKDGRPVKSWPDIDEALADVALQVRKAVEARGANKLTLALVPAASAAQTPANAPASQAASLPRSSNLRLKKEFSEKDKDDFLRETYDYVAKFFEGSLIELERRNQGTSYSFERIDTRRFAAVVYQAGKTMAECSVRIDSLGGRGSNCIAFCHDANARSNTSNEMLNIEVSDQSIYLKPLGMAWSGGGKDQRLSSEGAAEYLWTMFIGRIQGR